MNIISCDWQPKDVLLDSPFFDLENFPLLNSVHLNQIPKHNLFYPKMNNKNNWIIMKNISLKDQNLEGLLGLLCKSILDIRKRLDKVPSKIWYKQIFIQ